MVRLRFAFCGECGYDLQGLPQDGVCPECGSTYDKSSRRGVSEHGESAARLGQRERRMAKLRTVGLFTAAGLVLVGGVTIGMMSKTPEGPMIAGGMLAVLLTLAGLMSVLDQRRGKEDRG